MITRWANKIIEGQGKTDEPSSEKQKQKEENTNQNTNPTTPNKPVELSRNAYHCWFIKK